MNNAKTFETLIKIKELINTPDKWAKGTFARDKDGIATDFFDEKACKFCLQGAINKVTDCELLGNHIYIIMQDNLEDKYGAISNFNDDRYTTHKDIMDFLDSLIDSVKPKEIN